MAQTLTAHARQDCRTPHTRQPQRSVHRPIRRKPDDTKRGCQVCRLPRSEFLTGQTEVWLRRKRLELDFRVVVVGMIFPVKVGVGDGRFRARLVMMVMLLLWVMIVELRLRPGWQSGQ